MTDTVQRPTTQPTPRGWLFGPATGLVVFCVMIFGGLGFSVTDGTPVDTMVDRLADARATLMLSGAAQALTAFGLVVFGAWLAVRLDALEPPGSVLSRVAGGGCVLTAAVVAVAAAHTQLATMAADGTADPAIDLTLHALEENLYAGAWCSLALASGAVAVAALRHRVLPMWLGAVSAFVTVLLVVLQIVVPWAGWFPAFLWLVVAGSGLRRPAGMTAA